MRASVTAPMTSADQTVRPACGRPARRRVAVVGAGLAGLRAAWELKRRNQEVVVFEARDQAGGKAASEVALGFTLDRCLPLVSFDDRRLLDWIRDLGVGPILFPLRAVSVAHLHGGQVLPCDPGSLLGIARTPGVHVRDACRLLRLPRLMRRYAALLDLDAPERAAALDYRSTADFARLYLGRSVFERFAAPFVTATSLDDAGDLSRVALLLALHASRGGAATSAIPAAGLQELVAAAASKLDVRTGVKVVQLRELASGALSVVSEGGAGAGSDEFDAVVLSTSAGEAGRIAKEIITPAERDFFAGVESTPLVTLSVALEQTLSSVPQLVRVPPGERSPIEVLLLEPGAQGGRAPEHRNLVTLCATRRFAKRHELSPDEVVQTELLRALQRIHPRVEGLQRFARLHRDPAGMPRFVVGAYRALARFQRVQRDRQSLGRSLYYAGDYLAGPRLEDALASGHRAAGDVVANLPLTLAG